MSGKKLEIAERVREGLSRHSEEGKAQWLENYVKHNIRSRGVGIPKIREVVRDVNGSEDMASLPVPAQAAVLDDLMSGEYTEDKLAAILYQQLFWGDVAPAIQLEVVEKWFDREWISDWNVCDWLCVRVLTPLVDGVPQVAIPVFEKWNHSPLLWKARASLVPFAQSKTIANYGATIRRFSENLIRREERFCKTAVGWVMREYSRHDPDFVRAFLSEFEKHISREVERNARKYLDKKNNGT